MADRSFVALSLVLAALALLVNAYMRFVRHWAMNFGPMLLFGLGLPLVLGAVGALAGRRTEYARSLVLANGACVVLGWAIGYV